MIGSPSQNAMPVAGLPGLPGLSGSSRASVEFGANEAEALGAGGRFSQVLADARKGPAGATAEAEPATRRESPASTPDDPVDPALDSEPEGDASLAMTTDPSSAPSALPVWAQMEWAASAPAVPRASIGDAEATAAALAADAAGESRTDPLAPPLVAPEASAGRTAASLAQPAEAHARPWARGARPGADAPVATLPPLAMGHRPVPGASSREGVDTLAARHPTPEPTTTADADAGSSPLDLATSPLAAPAAEAAARAAADAVPAAPTPPSAATGAAAVARPAPESIGDGPVARAVEALDASGVGRPARTSPPGRGVSSAPGTERRAAREAGKDSDPIRGAEPKASAARTGDAPTAAVTPASAPATVPPTASPAASAPTPLTSPAAVSTTSPTGAAASSSATAASPAPFIAQLSPHVTSPAFAPALGLQVSMLVRNGIGQAQLNLNPAEWGPIAVKIELEGRQAQVMLAADHLQTRSVLEMALPDLATAMSDAGFTLSGGGVSQQGASAGSGGGFGQPSAAGRSAAATTPADTVSVAMPEPRSARGLVDLVA